MSQRGIDFLNGWLIENINAEGYAEEGKPDDRVPPLVAMCLAEAKAQGITRKEIEDDMGPISDRIAEALEEATDNEVERLVRKNP